MTFEATLSGIPPGPLGTRATLAAMDRAVREGLRDPAVVLHAQNVVAGLPENDARAEAEAIFQEVRDRFRYTRDPLGVEAVKTPTFVLREIRSRGWATGDCDDQSTFLAALLRAVGIPTRFRAIRASRARPGEFSHVYVEAMVGPGEWAPLDPIARDYDAWQAPEALFGSMLGGGAGGGGAMRRHGDLWTNAEWLASREFGYGGFAGNGMGFLMPPAAVVAAQQAQELPAGRTGEEPPAAEPDWFTRNVLQPLRPVLDQGAAYYAQRIQERAAEKFGPAPPVSAAVLPSPALYAPSEGLPWGKIALGVGAAAALALALGAMRRRRR